MYGYIYLTTNLINSKKYIGQHKAEEFDPMYKGSGLLLTEAIEKYGWDNFSCEILKECNTPKELSDAEYYYIQLYNAVADPNFYNLTEGGRGGDIFNNPSRERQDAWREHISKALSDKPKSEEHKNRARLTALLNGSHAGKRNSHYGTHPVAHNVGKKAYNNGQIAVYATDQEAGELLKQGFVRGGLPRNPKGTFKDRREKAKEEAIQQLLTKVR